MRLVGDIDLLLLELLELLEARVSLTLVLAGV